VVSGELPDALDEVARFAPFERARHRVGPVGDLLDDVADHRVAPAAPRHLGQLVSHGAQGAGGLVLPLPHLLADLFETLVQ